MTEETIQEGRSYAIVSYITIIGTIIAFFMNNGLWLTFFALGYVVGIFDKWIITLAFWLFFGILFIYGFINAVAGRPQTVPLLGEFYQKIFSSIG